MAQTLPQRDSDTSGEAPRLRRNVSAEISLPISHARPCRSFHRPVGEYSWAGSRCPRLQARRKLRRPCHSDAQQLFRRRAFRKCTWLHHRICDRRPLRSRARPLHSRTRRLSRRCARHALRSRVRRALHICAQRLSRRCARHALRSRVRRALRICAQRLFRRCTWLRHRIYDRRPLCSRTRPLHSRTRRHSRRLAQQPFRSPARRPLRWLRGALRATAMAAPATQTRPLLRPIELQPSKSPPRDETTCRGRLPVTSSRSQANTVGADAYSAQLPLKAPRRCSDEKPACDALR
jgi:hypothetical protein